jgi:hypothetical protein
MRSGAIAARKMGRPLSRPRAGFLSSQEYVQDHGNNIVDWLFGDYRATLNRLPDLNGFDYWESQLQ